MDDESGESMELMEKMPLKELGEAELERLVRGWRRGAGSWFQRREEAYWKEQSVIRREDDVDGRASVTKDEERVLRGGWTVMRLYRYEGWVVTFIRWTGELSQWLWSWWQHHKHCHGYYVGLSHLFTLCWKYLSNTLRTTQSTGKIIPKIDQHLATLAARVHRRTSFLNHVAAETEWRDSSWTRRKWSCFCSL